MSDEQEVMEGEGEEQQPEEQEPEEPKNFLKQEHIDEGLSLVSKTSTGESFAYSNLNVEEKEIEELGDLLLNYPHVSTLNISKNQIKDFSAIKQLNNLMVLDGSSNQLTDTSFLEAEGTNQALQIVNLSQNKLTTAHLISGIIHKFTAIENEITLVDFQNYHSLAVLELRKNQLKNLTGISNMRGLRELYVAENQIKSLVGLENLDSLEKLHLRGNQLKIIDTMPHLPQLTYINLRENPIERFITLKMLARRDTLPKLSYINCLGCPISDEKGEDFKKEVLILIGEKMKFLKKINKEDVTKEDRAEAIQEQINRIKQAEEEAREREREKANEDGEAAQEEAD